MFYSLLTLNFAALVALLCIGSSRRYGSFAGSALNPLNLFAVLSLFYNIDFWMIWSKGQIHILEFPISLPEGEVERLYLTYTLLFGSTLLGLVMAHFGMPIRPRRLSSWRPGGGAVASEMRRASRVVITVGLMGGLAVLATVAGSLDELLAGRMTFQVFSRENQFVFVAVGFLQPSLALYLSVRRPWSWHALLVIGVSLAVCFASGTRTNVIFMLMIVAVALIANGIRIPMRWYGVAVPAVAIFLTFSRYLLRESWRWGSYSDFTEGAGGYAELFFGSEEIGVAKALSTILLTSRALDRSPWESLWSMLLFPVPRAAFPLKPLGASAYFTEQMAPTRWLFTKSEITITGYGELVLLFGVLATAVILAVLAYLWLRACIRAIHSSQQRMVVWMPFLLCWMFLFLRTDLYNMSGSMWFFALGLGVYRLSMRTVGSAVSSNRTVAPAGREAQQAR